MKKIHSLAVIAAMSVGTLAFAGVAFSTGLSDKLVSSVAKDIYTARWTEGPEILDDGTMILRGEQGGAIQVDATGLAQIQKGVCSLAPGGSFKNVGTPDLPGIGSIHSVTLKYTIGDSLVNYDGLGSPVLSLRSGVNFSSERLLPVYGSAEAFQLSKTFVEEKPSYVEFTNTGTEIINISEISIDYGCLSHEYYNAPQDQGLLQEYVFEFEEASVEGNSKKPDNTPNDHFCAANTFMINPTFSGGICIENLLVGTKLSFDITSSETLTVPFKVALAFGDNTRTVDSLFKISNNGNTSLVNAYEKLPNEPDYIPDYEQWLANYFQMRKAGGDLTLVKGNNHIEFELLAAGANLDSFIINTSATLTDNTIGFFEGENAPTIEIVKQSTIKDFGEIKVSCNHGGCTTSAKSISLARLTNPDYEVRKVVNTGHYYLTLLGQEFECGTAELDRYPIDEGIKSDYYFEFENAKIDGPSKTGQVVNDHFCVRNSFVFSKDFSGNVCLENTVANQNTFTFVINSSEEIRVPFTMGIGTLNGRRLSEVFDMKINGVDGQVLNTDKTTTVTTTPDVGNLSQWFNMIEAHGELLLDKGDNVLTIFSKDYINMDYLKVSTSATIIDKTVATFSGDNAPTITIEKVPTETEMGLIQAYCNDPLCKSHDRTFVLPVLGTSCYYEKDGHTFIKLYNQEILVK